MTFDATSYAANPVATDSATPAAPVARLDVDMPSLAVLQHRYVDRVLERTGRNKTRAARMLARDRARGASVKV